MQKCMICDAINIEIAVNGIKLRTHIKYSTLMLVKLDNSQSNIENAPLPTFDFDISKVIFICMSVSTNA